ncbi:hypothetical protein BKA93DRAFT_318154 [Sparassis latifolia]
MQRPSSRPGTYTQESALDDLPAIKYAMSLFLNSDMVEAEQYCDELDPNKERLYITVGYSLIQCLKAFMSYEDKVLIAHKLRVGVHPPDFINIFGIRLRIRFDAPTPSSTPERKSLSIERSSASPRAAASASMRSTYLPSWR